MNAIDVNTTELALAFFVLRGIWAWLQRTHGARACCVESVFLVLLSERPSARSSLGRLNVHRRYIASGQGGHNSDVIVWSFQERSLVFRLSEHDHGVAFVDFSHDDRLLLSGGVPEDRKILIWDMSNGCIVAIVQHDPVPTTVAAWGGMVRCGRCRVMSTCEIS